MTSRHLGAILAAIGLFVIGCGDASSDDSASSDSALAPRTTCSPATCAEGSVPADFDGDGCLESCKPVACPPVIVTCPEGQRPADLDGDGCALECE